MKGAKDWGDVDLQMAETANTRVRDNLDRFEVELRCVMLLLYCGCVQLQAGKGSAPGRV